MLFLISFWPGFLDKSLMAGLGMADLPVIGWGVSMLAQRMGFPILPAKYIVLAQ